MVNMVITVIIVFTIAFVLNLVLFLLLYFKLKEMLLMQVEKYLERAYFVMKGKVGENIAPFLHDFPYSPKDLVFLGNPVDFVVFDGLSKGHLKQIVFLEVKSGKSKLNANERLVKEIIKAKRVFWDEYRIKE